MSNFSFYHDNNIQLHFFFFFLNKLDLCLICSLCLHIACKLHIVYAYSLNAYSL